jgi:hypothetical protein
VLGSLNPVTKEAAIAAVILGRASPDPGLSPPVELRSGDAGGLLNLLGIGKTLASERIAAEEPPPALLQIEPARPSGYEHVMDTGMRFQPGSRFETAVTGEIVADDEDVPTGIVRFDVSQQCDIAFGVARSRAARQFLAVTHPQRPIDPGFFWSSPIVERRFDAVPIGRPAWSRIKGAWDYRSQFVGANGRRAFRGLGVMDDDRCSFGTKSLSRGSLQLCVLRQRTLSRKRMRRTWLRLTGTPAS